MKSFTGLEQAMTEAFDKYFGDAEVRRELKTNPDLCNKAREKGLELIDTFMDAFKEKVLLPRVEELHEGARERMAKVLSEYLARIKNE